VVKLSTGSPLGQGYIRGQVKDASTNKAIQGATVEASGPTTSSTTTDSNGNYTLTLPPGTYTLTAKASGYQSQTKTYVIATLRYKIDPATLEPVEGSGPIHVYLDLQGNPISDPEVARKVGQIDWALKRKPEIPGKISDLTYRKTLVERIDSLRNQLNSTEFVLKRIKDVATAVQYKEELLILMLTMKETYWLILEIGSSVETTHLEYFKEKIEIYIGLIEKKEITIDVVKAIQGFLVQGACWLLKKMFFDPEKEAHAELLGCLNLALQYYQEAGRLADTDLKNFENASQFVAAALYGDGYLKAADYLWGKLMSKFLDTSRHILSKCKELGLDFVTLGFYPFLKLAWQASELTNWTVDVLYQKTYTLLSVPAYLRYWLFESATYTLELAGKQRDIREYQRKFDRCRHRSHEESRGSP
jgi:hypothetical protein